MKIFARVAPSMCSRFLTPGRLYITDVAASAHGIWTQPLQAENWSGDSGASLAPKSTVRPVIALIPPLEPIALYCSVTPSAGPTALVQVRTSGDTNVLPAPVMTVSVRVAEAAPEAMPAVRAARAATRAIFVKLPTFGIGFSPLSGSPRAYERAGGAWANGLFPPGDGVVNGPVAAVFARVRCRS